jgi:hypothetical protein
VRGKLTQRTVVVGRSEVTLQAGQTQLVAIRLDAAGRALLARRHHIPVKLSTVQSAAGGSHPHALASRTLTLSAGAR